jgi:ubiquinone/menaquinone biosynthesis C-methylase UbiE
MTRINQSGKFYFDNPEVFERVHQARFKPESDFVHALLSQHASFSLASILDVACGTGTHASLLTEAGFSVTGLDLNPFMIEFAHKKHPTLAFLLGDMRALPFSNAFDAMICMCSSFSYNNSNEEIAVALQGFSRSLKQGGLGIIDVFNPLSLLERRAFASEIREETKYAQVGMYSVSEISIETSNQLLVEKRSLFRIEDDKPVQSDVTKFRLFFPQELRYFLETNGFKNIVFYSSFDINDQDLKGARLIALAKKT